ncbi:hypothetical protein JOE58_001947 [Curtobacterium luteum]|uniref:Bacterial Ig-like domain-containing protein n=1 Tax=Curtobacterium luteum TaxID=33881 RepID=A0A8H9GDP6_9MICO|nr:hypothetical protein [Curtobacterium luteum]MBM7802696.1 hypothetical protein [Curtobacterium luteum]NUU49699.1 hypothetical protein [Curtobacterium luteum]GGL10705.1 hypothetical protein GCM10009769_30980 [Curtobacterium luteum]
MDRHRRQPPRRRRGARSLGARSLGARSLGAAAVVAALALAGSLVALPAVAAPADGTPADGTGATITTGDSPVASGDGWTVTAVAGGYVVTLTLDEPLPIRAAAPTLVVDGRDIGIASTSIDQRTLTVTTTDPSVASATSVVLGSTGGVQRPSGPSVSAQATPGARPEETPAPLDADPAAAGPYSVVRADYDLGDQAETIRGFRGRKGEMRAAVWLPANAPGKRPVAVFLHGRHEACVGGTPTAAGWPCGKNQTVIPSYLGYNAAAQALASNGVAVVSISADAINALDGTYADDGGATARGQLVLDHLALLQRADAGDEPRLSPALVGKLDLQHVGLMGHSRGGDGVVRAALLNAQRKQPFGITAVMPLAPTDFGRTTLPDVDTAVVLPYCDGDVSDLQGQQFFDDSRTAYGDDVLRSSVLVMGANHNFFNSVWTPATYPKASFDDWWDQQDPVCGAKAKGTTRLSSSAQYAVGTSLVSGYFRLTLGGEQQFLPYFDGSGRVPSALGTADVRVTASLPGGTRRDLALFTAADPAVTTRGAVRAVTCASTEGVAGTPALPACVTGATTAPDYVQAWLAPSVPATPALHVVPTGTASGGAVKVAVDPAAGDLSSFSTLSVRLSPDDRATAAADVSLRVTDASGASATRRLSDVSRAGALLPGSRDAVRKTLLQQAQVPLSAFTGIDLTNVRQVAVMVPKGRSGLLLSDLSALPASSLGTPKVVDRPTVRVADRFVNEGNAKGTARVAVVLSRPAEQTATVAFDLDAWDGAVSSTVQDVVFRPGEVCHTVAVPVFGDRRASESRTTAYPLAVSTTQGGAVLGDGTGTLTLREDDGVSIGGTSVSSAPPVGRAGDACAEAQAGTGTVTANPTRPQRAHRVVFTSAGFRPGESVAVRIDGGAATRVVADTTGTATLTVAKSTQSVGAHVVTARGYGSDRAARGSFTVRR